jgi:prophage antirepressor-like protein
MSLLKVFTSAEGSNIRVQKQNGEHVFCAKDICAALSISHVGRKVSTLDEDEKLTLRQVTSGQMRKFIYVTEPGLYSLILGCRQARKPGTIPYMFRRFVTHEVLPALRRGDVARLAQLTAERQQVEQHMTVVQNTLQFVEANRFYKFARRHSALDYAALQQKRRRCSYLGHILWRDRIPFVRRGSEPTVRAILE